MNRQHEIIRTQMQEEFDAQKEAIDLWRAEDPAVRDRIIPQPWELTNFLMKRLKKQQAGLRAAVKRINAIQLTSDDAALTRRLEGLL